VFDCSRFGLSFARKLSKEDQKVEAEMMETLPIRIKKFIIFSSPWYLRWFFKIYMFFASEKMRKRFAFAKPENMELVVPGMHDFTPETVAQLNKSFLERIRYLSSLE
jgi:hypothetical protein